ncbi:MAG: hypothetical protein U5K72_18195 [Balneolaceae bacterium]|nr:hypothetical protein [Balneolaceae bacterium]
MIILAVGYGRISRVFSGERAALRQTWNLVDVLPRFTEESIRVIENHGSANSNQPLFLYVAFRRLILPQCQTEEFEGVSGGGIYGRLYRDD